VDTYKTYGDKIHHNIFIDLSEVAIRAKQDFVQVYNNIVSNSGGGVKIGHERRIYKAVVYNNTIISSQNAGQESLPFERKLKQDYSYENVHYYGWDFNNIIEDGASAWCGGEFALGYSRNDVLPNLENYHNISNYFYRGRDSNVISLSGNGNRIYYTVQSYKNAFPNHSVFSNDYRSSDSLHLGSQGADLFKVSADHAVSTNGETISNAGYGAPHPYLDGVYIPSYIGAVDPQNTSWVDQVLRLDNTNILIAGDTDIVTNPNHPKNLRVVDGQS
jgi:hypothetical protein